MTEETPKPRSCLLRAVRGAGWTVLGLVLTLWGFWCLATLWVDGGGLGPLFGGLVILGVVLMLVRIRPLRAAALAVAALFAVVFGWWTSLDASNDRDWQPDVARTAWAEIDGDLVTIHDIRDCEYRSETDFTTRYRTRTVRLSKLTGLDMFLCYWGSPWIAHPIMSFQFEDADPICISVETRKEVGETYSAALGFFRQFELTYIVAEERDVVGVRTIHRPGEEAFVYRMTAPAERVRAFFLDYLKTVNELHEEARWYNALTNNCATNVRTHAVATDKNPKPWDWRILLPGRVDELIDSRGGFQRDLPFDEFKRQARVNDAARAAGGSDDFPRLIRAGKDGWDEQGRRR